MLQIDKSVNLTFKVQNLLYREGTNLIISPFSIEVLSFSILVGANAQCLEELNHCLFGVDVDAADITESLRCFKLMIDHTNTFPNVDFKMSNFVYISEKFEIKQTYSDFILNFFNTKVKQINFEDETLEVYNSVDQDMRQASGGRINKILKCLPTVSRLLLVNSINFQSELKCKPSQQYEGKFLTSNTEDAKVCYTVQQCNFKFIDKSPEYVYVELPYKNENANINLCIVFPNVGVSLRDLLLKLEYATLMDLSNSSEETELEVHLPFVKIQSNVDLAMVMQLSGMTKVFEEENADLSKMVVNSNGLYLESVVTHSELLLQDTSKLSSNTKKETSAPVNSNTQTLVLNRPFIFYVMCDLKKKLQTIILFSGVVNIMDA